MIKIYRVNHEEKKASYIGALEKGGIKEQVSNELDNLFSDGVPTEREAIARFKKSSNYIIEDTENLNFTDQMIADLNGDKL